MNSGAELPKRISVNGVLRAELRLGVVSSVTANLARINLFDAGNPSGTHFEGRRYGRGEVGEFVLIEGQQSILLGRLIEIWLPEKERQAIGLVGTRNIEAIGNVQLLGSIAMTDLAVSSGVAAYPRLGDRVYSAPYDLIAQIPLLMKTQLDADSVVTLKVGMVGAGFESVVQITPEKLFGRHCAILGATGGGKSWTTAQIIEQCIQYQCKAILIDATSEYRTLSGEYTMHVHLGNPLETASGSVGCSVPPTCFQETDFLALFQPSGKVQGPKLQAAIRSLRLVELIPELGTGGLLLKINQKKRGVEDAENSPDIAKKLENPTQPFSVQMLARQIEQECVYPDGFSNRQKDTSVWGGETGDFSYCLPLIARINGVISSPAFNCVFDSHGFTPLTDVINRFLNSDNRLLRICLAGIHHEFRAREIIANSIGRHLLALGREGKFASNPVVIFLDEAHHFLGKTIGGEDSIARLDSFELIAKEGRKYGVNICLATQRPRDITEGVLSQMGTLVVHRLTNDRDREIVERACGEIDKSASSFLPSLRPGEAAIIGVDFPIPLTIRMLKPVAKPTSAGPKYQEAWKPQA